MMDDVKYSSSPKNDPTGAATVNPVIRPWVMSGSRHSTNRNVSESRSAIPALLKGDGLSASEYSNRKMLELRNQVRDDLKLQSYIEAGMSPEEAARKIAYNKQAIRDLAKQDLPEYDDLHNRRFNTREDKIEVLMGHWKRIVSEKEPQWNDRAVRIAQALEELGAPVYGTLGYDEKLKTTTLNGKPPMSIEEAILMLVDTKPDGWETKVTELREQLRHSQMNAPKEEVFDLDLLERRAKAGERLSVTETRALHDLVTQRLIKSGQLDQMKMRGNVEPPPPVVDFTVGDLEQPARFIIRDLKGFEFNPETRFDGLRLPYESCLFVLGTSPKAVVLATQEADDVITLKLLSEQRGDMPWHASATLHARLKNNKAETRWASTKRSLDKRLAMVSTVLGFLAGEQLDDVVIETVITAPERDVPPPKPGHCYSVISITQGRKGKRRDWQGGTHASPREHHRRGYWWPGKNGPVWIKPTIVNKGVLGRVDKEYHVTKIED